MLVYDSDYLFPILAKALCESGTKVEVLKIGESKDRRRAEFSLEHAAHKTLSDLRPRSYPGKESAHAFTNTFIFSSDRSWRAAFGHLRELDIQELTVDLGVKKDVSNITDSIYTLLTSASLIEKIDIGDINPYCSARPMSKLNRTLPSSPMRHLRRLSLYFYEDTENEMLRFLDRDSQTLEEIGFACVCISGGQWLLVLKKARNSKWLRLKSFIPDSCMDGLDFEIKVEDYLRSLTDINPIEEELKKVAEEEDLQSLSE